MRAMATLEPGAAAGADRRAAVPDAAALLSLKFCRLDFASPIVLLSGCVGFGEEYTRIEGFSNRDAGAVVLKGTTGEPRLGNPPHRVYETPAGMLNAIGLQNPGVEQVVRGILPQLDFTETRSEEHTSELQSRLHLVSRLLLAKKNTDRPGHTRAV